MIEWRIRCCSDVGVNVKLVKVEMFEWGTRASQKYLGGNVRVVLECMFEDVVGHHQDILEEMFERCSWASSIYLYWMYSRVTG